MLEARKENNIPSHISNILGHHVEHVVRQVPLTELLHQRQVVDGVVHGCQTGRPDLGAGQRVWAVEADEGRQSYSVAEVSQ